MSSIENYTLLLEYPNGHKGHISFRAESTDDAKEA